MDIMHLLVVSSTLLSLIIFVQYVKKNNIIGVMYSAAFIFMVIGQNINIMFSLDDSSQVYYLYNYINYQGHFYANIILFFILLNILLFINFLQKNSVSRRNVYNKVAIRGNINIYYNSQMIILPVLSWFLINIVGGLDDWANTSRPVASGSTFFLVLLTGGIYPALFKIMSGSKVLWKDLILSFLSIGLVISFSRFLGLFMLLQLLCAWYYSGESKELKNNLGIMISSGFVFFVVFFIYGNYRHMIEYTQGMSIAEIIEYVLDHWETSLFSLDYNYHVGIEGMSGLSGILTFVEGNGDYFNIDFGLSALAGVLKIFPSTIRDFLVGDLLEYVQSIYWYRGSIVSSGLECFFMHFSIFIVLIYPAVWYFYTGYLHRKLSLRKFNFLQVMYLVIVVYGINIIRGTTANVLFYTFCEIIVAYLSYKWYRCLYVDE